MQLQGICEARAHLHRVRLLLLLLDVLGRARAPLLRDDQGRGCGLGRATATSSRSPATTATCCSTSCRSACRCSASSRPPTWPRPRAAQNVPTLVEFFGTTLRRAARRRGQARRSHHRQQRAGAGAGPQRLRRRHEASCWRRKGVITLEFPHLERLIDENQFDTIYHEHFSYFSLVTIDRLAERHGLKIIRRREAPDARRIAAGLSGRTTPPRASRRRASATLLAHEIESGFETSRPMRALPSRCTAPSASCCRS